MPTLKPLKRYQKCYHCRKDLDDIIFSPSMCWPDFLFYHRNCFIKPIPYGQWAKWGNCIVMSMEDNWMDRLGKGTYVEEWSETEQGRFVLTGYIRVR